MDKESEVRKMNHDLKMRRKGEKKRASPCHIWNKCSGCYKRIRSRYLVKALGRTWHERCLKCDSCDEILCSFREASVFYRNGLKLCKKDYLGMYGRTGLCSMCDEIIMPTEKVVRFKNKYVYHCKCFQCIECKTAFRKGDFAGIPHPKHIFCYDHYQQYSMAFSNDLQLPLILNNEYAEEREFCTNKTTDYQPLELTRSSNNTLQCSLFQDLPNPPSFNDQERMLWKDTYNIEKLESDKVTIGSSYGIAIFNSENTSFVFGNWEDFNNIN